MTNEERRALANLIMLCAVHHAAIDGNPAKYTVAALKKMKHDHEAKFTELDDRLQQRFVEQFTDHTEALAPTVPKTLAGMPELQSSTADIPKVINEVADYVDRLSKVPDRERQFLLALIRRSEKLGFNRHPFLGLGASVSVSTEDIKSALGIGDRKIKTLADAFERYRIGGLNDAGEREYEVYAREPSGYISWPEIVEFAAAKGIGT